MLRQPCEEPRQKLLELEGREDPRLREGIGGMQPVQIQWLVDQGEESKALLTRRAYLLRLPSPVQHQAYWGGFTFRLSGYQKAASVGGDLEI